MEDQLKVLVVDDEYAVRRFLKLSLAGHGHTVFEAASGAEALEIAIKQRPDVIFLGLDLPDLDGIDVTRHLREWSNMPIIVLSSTDGEREKIDVLDAGADDYLTKPFSMGELMARMRVALRHRLAPGLAEPSFAFRNLKVDLTSRQVLKDEHEVVLTPTEYDLLKVLIQHAGKVMTHKQIIKALWSGDYSDTSHLLRVNISNLRRKIEADPTRPGIIVTEPGVGYRLRFGG